MRRISGEELNSIVSRVGNIRKKWQFRMDADSDEGENDNQNSGEKKKTTALGVRLPYGLCKDVGIDTTGMTPREAWDAYYKKTGISKKEAFEKKVETGDKDINPEDPEKDKEVSKKDEPVDSFEEDKPVSETSDKPESKKTPDDSVEKESSETEKEASDNEVKKVQSTEKAVELDIPYTSPLMQEYASKVQKPKMDTSVKSLSGWGQVAADFADMSDSNYGEILGCKTADELVETQEKLQAIFDNSELCCDVNAEFLQSIVTDHLMNQFETGTTSGSTDLKSRRAAASNMFDLGKTAAVDREKYGYMADREDYETTFGIKGPGYGYNGSGVACCLVFKKDRLAERTTYTADDSLGIADYSYGDMSAGAVDTSCSLEGLSFEESIAEKLRSGEYKSISDMILHYDYKTGKSSGSICYVECQYHGHVDGSDIEAIRFGTEDDMNKTINGWSPEMWDAVEANGIGIGYFGEDKKLVKTDAHSLRAFYGPL